MSDDAGVPSEHVGWMCNDWSKARDSQLKEVNEKMHKKRMTEELVHWCQRSLNHTGEPQGRYYQATGRLGGAFGAAQRLGKWCYYELERRKREKEGKSPNLQQINRQEFLYERALPMYLKWRPGDSIWPRKKGVNIDYWTSKQLVSLSRKWHIHKGEPLKKDGYWICSAYDPGAVNGMFFGVPNNQSSYPVRPILEYAYCRRAMISAAVNRDKPLFHEYVDDIMAALDRLDEDCRWPHLTAGEYAEIYNTARGKNFSTPSGSRHNIEAARARVRGCDKHQAEEAAGLVVIRDIGIDEACDLAKSGKNLLADPKVYGDSAAPPSMDDDEGGSAPPVCELDVFA